MDQPSTIHGQGQRAFASVLAGIRCGLLAVLLLVVSGCINGPVRGRLNGRFNYLTAETARCAPWYTYPLSLPAAAVGDAGIILADTLAVPVAVLNRAFHTPIRGSYGPAILLCVPLLIPLYPIKCVEEMLSEYDTAPAGVLYQKLFGHYTMKTDIGRLRIASVVDSSDTPKMTIELDGETIGDFPAELKIMALKAEGNYLAIVFSNDTIWWRQCSSRGKWLSQKSSRLFPNRQEVLTAINLSKLLYSSKEYENFVEIKQEIEAGQPLKISFIEFGHNEFSPVYSLSFTCQSHRFTADCWTDGTNLHLGRLFIQR